MSNEQDEKVKAYMAAHPELVAKIAEKHGVKVVEEEDEEEGLPEDYLTQTVEEEQPPKPTRKRRFGEGSNAEGPDEILYGER